MKNISFDKQIQSIKKAPHPRVLLNVCTHGTEKVGLKVAKHFEHTAIKKGTFYVHIANKVAAEKNVRFIESDLNRAFPGKKNGDYEERLAYKLAPFVGSFDYVIDIHSTETGTAVSAIVTHYTKRAQAMLQVLAPRRVLIMSATKSNALISGAKCGIALEFGKDKDPRTYRASIAAVESVLRHLEMFSSKKVRLRQESEVYEVYEAVSKPKGYVNNLRIRNFTFLKKGSLLGHNPSTKAKMYSQKSFYPILFGKNKYETIFGFAAKKVAVKKSPQFKLRGS